MLTISTRPCAPGGVAIVVRDTGIGIAPEIIDDIFEPFFTTKGPDHGTGLGLATVREIASRNGGGVRVTSKLGEGSAFEIWLPGVEGIAYETGRMANVVPAGRGEQVLVVEDDARVRETTRRVLASGGYAVYDVRDAEAALSYVSRGPALDLLVADIELPGLSGVDCARQIVASTPRAAVLYTSGMMSDPRVLGGICGAVFLAKPYSSDQLMRSVRRAIESRNPSRSPLG